MKPMKLDTLLLISASEILKYPLAEVLNYTASSLEDEGAIRMIPTHYKLPLMWKYS